MTTKVTFWLVVAVSKTGTPWYYAAFNLDDAMLWVDTLKRDRYTVLPPEKIEREVP
jgi:hypothetical protein